MNTVPPLAPAVTDLIRPWPVDLFLRNIVKLKMHKGFEVLPCVLHSKGLLLTISVDDQNWDHFNINIWAGLVMSPDSLTTAPTIKEHVS